MDSALTPLLVVVAFTAALIPVLLLSMLGRGGPTVVTVPQPLRDAEPIWRAWVDEPAALTGAPGPRCDPELTAPPSDRVTARTQMRRRTRSDPHSPSSTNSPESRAARQMS